MPLAAHRRADADDEAPQGHRPVEGAEGRERLARDEGERTAGGEEDEARLHALQERMEREEDDRRRVEERPMHAAARKALRIRSL